VNTGVPSGVYELGSMITVSWMFQPQRIQRLRHCAVVLYGGCVRVHPPLSGVS
jgi:hypothetical protein